MTLVVFVIASFLLFFLGTVLVFGLVFLVLIPLTTAVVGLLRGAMWFVFGKRGRHRLR